MLNTNNNGSQNENNKQQQQQKTRNNKHKSMLHNMFFMNLNLINDQKEIIINRISCNIPIYEYLHGISNIRLIRTNIKTTTKTTTTTCRTSTWLRFFYTCLILSSLCQHTKCLHNSFKLSTNLVRTKYGLIRGIVVRNTPLVEAYLGIPYASPPMGSLRYMPPITPSTWKNVRTADRFSPVCPQTVPIPPNGPEALLEVPRARLAQLRRLLPLLKNQSEDCLYLNIYAPVDNRHNNGSKESSSSKLSTILYIHGESYEWGSGNPFDGTELATHGNVIVVTINFRLGIFGFLKTGGKESAQGNFGLMDLVAGMHWLKENLVAFGGNPQNITLLGHGSGAALANILAVSPVASDLLQRVVLVSGSALSPWALQKNPLFVKRRVAEQTGCHGDMLYDDLAPCLRTKSITDLLAVKIDHPRFLTGFAPFPDGTVIAANTESHDWPLPPGSTIVSATGIEFANFHKRDLIFCLNSVESYLDLSAQDLEFGFNETRRDRILRTFVRNNFHFHLNEIFAVLKNEYTDWERVIRNPMSARDATLAFLSDGHTAAPLIKVGYMHSLRGGRGYFIHFKHKTAEQEYPQRTGSVGGEDIPFWLGLPSSQLFPYNYTTQEKQISRYMLHYLANFVKTGNPNNAAEFPSKSNRGIFGHVYRKSSESEKRQVKRSSYKLSPLEQLSKNRTISEQRKALNLAIIYNQRIRNKRDFYKQHLSKEDDDSNYFIENNNKNNYIEETEEPELGPVLMGREHFILPYWDAYDVVNQLYLEMGSKPKIQSHYRGHKLSMWLNLIPQLHKHTNLNEQSMRHHFFPEHMDNLYEGAVRPQLPIRKMEVDEVVDLEQTTIKPIVIAKNPLVASNLTGTECAIDETNYSTEATTLVPKSNASSTSQKDLVTASTGIMGNLEVLRRLSSKQFQSYTTALVATVAVGFFLLVLNVLIFAGIYHQREKRARDARTKEELEDKDNSKNSSILKLNTVGLSHAESYKGSVIFSDFNCYDERGIEHAKESLPLQTSAWSFSSSKPHPSISAGSYEFPVTLKKTDIHANLEHSSYNLCTGLVEGKQEYELANSCTLSEFDYAVQSSDRMSFKEIEAAVKVSNDNHDIDLEIPDPPPPPRSFNNMQQAGILRQTGTASGSGILAGASGTGKKRVHIQEISV